MAFRNLLISSKRYPFNYATFICDNENDISSLPTNKNKNDYRDAVCAGSTAFVIETSKKYMLNTNGEWTEIHVGDASSGGGISLDIASIDEVLGYIEDTEE